jgi:anhydro-N-acetylmuramic acid kinase
LRGAFFRQKPPKTAGREEFGERFVRDFLRRCYGKRKQDIVATATALTVRSIADAVWLHVLARKPIAGHAQFQELIVSGGGARNMTLLKMLTAELTLRGLRLRLSDEFGLPSVAKEAVAFALLAYQTWYRKPSNIASATGAKRDAVLGKISYP